MRQSAAPRQISVNSLDVLSKAVHIAVSYECSLFIILFSATCGDRSAGSSPEGSLATI